MSVRLIFVEAAEVSSERTTPSPAVMSVVTLPALPSACVFSRSSGSQHLFTAAEQNEVT